MPSLNDVQIKSGSSMERVVNAADKLGLVIDLREMDQSTHTAQDAAQALDCNVAQIVKSLVFADKDTGAVTLLLVSGAHNADLAHIADKHALKLERCDAKRVRDVTGFAIGGVAPIGHVNDLPIYMDERLLLHDKVWTAAGSPNCVFGVDPKRLVHLINAFEVCVNV